MIKKIFSTCVLAALVGAVHVNAQTTVYVDSGKSWLGYMSWTADPNDAPGYGGNNPNGQSWGTADLQAVFSGSSLTLAPNTNTYNATDPYWVNADGTGANIMDASMYVQDDTLAGQTVTFSGSCLTNTLVSPYTSVAFIKDFAPDYSSHTTVTNALVSGTPFSLTLSTSAGDHIQYGFETVGPNANPATADTLGHVEIAAITTAHVYVDPSQNWIGYMNVFDLSGNYQFGYAAPPADLDAGFTGGVAELTPCTSIYRDHPTNDTAWWNPDGTGNKNMDASFYVEDATLPGKVVTFSGFVWTNSLVTNYTSQAFIKELDPNNGYAVVGVATQALTSTNFSITLVTSNAAMGHVVQYGFETVGPNANLALTPLATLGHVLVSSNVQPNGPVVTSLTPASPAYINADSNVTFTVAATGIGLTYQWEKDGVKLNDGPNISGANSAALTLSNVTTAAEGYYRVVVGDNAGLTATAGAYLVVFDHSNLVFDPSATLNGYINTFYNNGTVPPVSSGGFPYPPARLRASVTNGIVLLQPNNDLYDINVTDPFWVYSDGSPNQLCEQDYYIANDALSGLPLTFSGYCLSNNLDASYTAVAWIKDLAPDYSTNLIISVNLVAGQPFSVSHTSTPGNHVQYGFYILGPDNSSTNPVTQGSVVVSLPAVSSPMLSAKRSGGMTSLSFPSVTGHNYKVQYKNNLTDSAWLDTTNINGTSSIVTVPDNTTDAQRFYRLSIK